MEQSGSVWMLIGQIAGAEALARYFSSRGENSSQSFHLFFNQSSIQGCTWCLLYYIKYVFTSTDYKPGFAVILPNITDTYSKSQIPGRRRIYRLIQLYGELLPTARQRAVSEPDTEERGYLNGILEPRVGPRGSGSGGLSPRQIRKAVPDTYRTVYLNREYNYN